MSTSAACARTRTRWQRRSRSGGLDVLTGGTDTHLLLVDLRRTEWTGKDAEERLAEVGDHVNRNTIPFDERPPTVASGFASARRRRRCGASTRTTSARSAGIMCEALTEAADLGALAGRTAALCERRPLYPGMSAFPTLRLRRSTWTTAADRDTERPA